MTHLEGEHATEQLRWSEYIKARFAAGLASAALRLTDIVVPRYEYEDLSEEEI